MSEGTTTEDKQCRICLDGIEAEHDLGRLIRPCLCKGSISYVHVKCLQQWRNTSASNSAFFACPQCHYKYRFSRTRITGIATNPVIVGGLSGIVFTVIVMLSSFITTYFMSVFEEPSYYYYDNHVQPLDVAKDFVGAALRIFQDVDGAGILEDVAPPIPLVASQRSPSMGPGILKSFVRRFLLGLPIVGAGSLIQMLLSVPLGPIHWLTRSRGGRRRNDSRGDMASLIIVVLIIVGAARALYKVYNWTQSMTQRLLLRAEDAILEVN